MPDPDAYGGHKILQGDQQTHRPGRDAEIRDHDPVPDAGQHDIAHGRTDMKATQAQYQADVKGQVARPFFDNTGRGLYFRLNFRHLVLNAAMSYRATFNRPRKQPSLAHLPRLFGVGRRPESR